MATNSPGIPGVGGGTSSVATDTGGGENPTIQGTPTQQNPGPKAASKPHSGAAAPHSGAAMPEPPATKAHSGRAAPHSGEARPAGDPRENTNDGRD